MSAGEGFDSAVIDSRYKSARQRETLGGVDFCLHESPLPCRHSEASRLIRLQGSRWAEDFAPDDGLAKGCRGFDDGDRLVRFGRGDFALGTRNGLHGFRYFLRRRAFYFLKGYWGRRLLGQGNSEGLEELAHLLLGSGFRKFLNGGWRWGGFEVGVGLRFLPAGALLLEAALLTAFAGLLDQPVDEADRSNNEEQDELFHGGIRPEWMQAAWLWSRAWRCRTGYFSSACSP